MKKSLFARITICVLTVSMFSVNACSCEDANIASYTAQKSDLDSAALSDSFVSGINQYGFTTLSMLYDGENVAISPASLEIAFLMAYSGADEETGDEMLDALCMSDLSEDEILASCEQLMLRVNSNGMETANSLWLQNDVTLSDSFIQTCNSNFLSDLYTVDFANAPSAAVDAINEWGSDNTDSQIEEIYSGTLSPDTQMVLVNTMYFLSDWDDQFSLTETKYHTFYGTNSESDVPFMATHKDMSYMETSTYQMVSLPFQDSTYSMAIILPCEDDGLSDVINEITEDGFSSSCSALAENEVIFCMPRFDFSYNASMSDVMQTLGMNLAFDASNAQFDAMTGTSNDLYISDVLHECSIAVDEDGVEVSASTEEVLMSKSASRNPDPIEYFTADHPFIFAIYDETDNAVLFLGTVGQL